MSYLDDLSLSFDPVTRIAELSALKVLSICSKKELNTLCSDTGVLLNRVVGDERCYLAVDIGKIVIDPGLADEYAQKVEELKSRFLFPGGLVRYGYEITRVTIKLVGLKTGELPVLFNKRDDAIKYLTQLSEIGLINTDKSNVAIPE